MTDSISIKKIRLVDTPRHQYIVLPRGSKILRVYASGGEIWLWYIGGIQEPEPRVILIINDEPINGIDIDHLHYISEIDIYGTGASSYVFEYKEGK